jgi:hypothetical protein
MARQKPIDPRLVPQESEFVARITLDSRDGSKDKFILRTKAQELFKKGKLWIDETNSSGKQFYRYCLQDNVGDDREIRQFYIK